MNRKTVLCILGLLILMVPACLASPSPAATQVPPTVAPSSPTSPASTSTPAATTTAATAGATASAAAASTLAPTAVQPTVTAAPPPQPDVLRVGIPFLRLLNPIRAYSYSIAVLGNVCERLLDRNAPGASSPYTFKLATALTPSADGLTWTAALRPGVKFHDGTPLTAADVKGSLLGARDHSDYPPAFAAIASIDTPDDHTVVFHLNSPRDLALVLAVGYGGYIISAKGLAADKANSNAFDKGLDACTGPYKLKSVTADMVDLELNTDYWNPVAVPGRPSTVEMHIVAEADEPQQVQNGQLELGLGLSDNATAMLKSNPKFTLYSAPTNTANVLFLNTQHPPLDDKRVRQALAFAIDTAAIMTQLTAATGLPLYPLGGPLAPSVYPYSAAAQQGAFDRAKTQQLLADAGHPGGGFSLHLAYFGTDPGPLVPLIVQDLAQVGVTVQPQGLDGAVLFKRITSSNPADHPDLFIGSNGPFEIDGAVNVLRPYYHSGQIGSRNYSAYNNPAYDQLVDSALAQEATNPDAALAQFAQAQKLLVDDVPAIFLFTGSANYALPNYLKGFAYNPNYGDAPDFYSMYYSPAK